jgi:hypothetical protein
VSSANNQHEIAAGSVSIRRSFHCLHHSVHRPLVVPMPIEINTRLVPIPGIHHFQPASPLGLLAPLTGKWTGQGFNQIFRPLHGPGGDNFLELNLTNETLEFTEIPGEIPNRGFVQQDISLFGLTYLQQVSDANVKDTNGNPAGIHIEPGIWLNIPATTDPQEQATVARLANIPHGTSLVAQGTATVVLGPPVFPSVDITPFLTKPPNTKFTFPSQHLATPSTLRSPDSDIVGITQAMVDNPNSFLQSALAGKVINATTVIHISTTSGPNTTPNTAGGISDIAFLNGTGSGPNAQVANMDATFWISNYTDASGTGTLLQYSQIVMLNFNTLSWPHVSVATLVKQHPPKALIKESKPEIKELKDHSELKVIELPIPLPGPGPDPGPAGPAAAAPAEGRHFIAVHERPAVGDPALLDPQRGAANIKNQ